MSHSLTAEIWFVLRSECPTEDSQSVEKQLKERILIGRLAIVLFPNYKTIPDRPIRILSFRKEWLWVSQPSWKFDDYYIRNLNASTL